jgi:hypothetical protein
MAIARVGSASSLGRDNPDLEQFAAIAHGVLTGQLQAVAVSLGASSDASPWLDAIERELFIDPARDVGEGERLRIACERAGFRAVRALAHDDPRAMAVRLQRAITDTPPSDRLRRLLAEFEAFGSMPGPGEKSVH